MPADTTSGWALITGASSGIGAEFARQLAARGTDLVLVARREQRLVELAAELETAGVRSVVMAADLSRPDAALRLWDEIRARGIAVDLLVNNAGFSLLAETPDVSVEQTTAMVRLHVEAATTLTWLALREMRGRGRGEIVNVSSVTAFQPVAYMSVYSASKAYLLHFSESLWAELRGSGVHVMALCPGTTRTELFDAAGIPAWLQSRRSQSPHEVVRAALSCLARKRPICIPGWRNRLTATLLHWLPRRFRVLASRRWFHPAAHSGDETV